MHRFSYIGPGIPVHQVLQQVFAPWPSLVDVAEFMALRTSTDWVRVGYRVTVAVGLHILRSRGRQTSQSLLPQCGFVLQTSIDLAAECPLDEVGTPIGRALEKNPQTATPPARSSRSTTVRKSVGSQIGV